MSEIELDEVVKTDSETKSSTKEDNGKVLYLWNDDFNTFDHVEESLMLICKHSQQKARECAMRVHNYNKCNVYKGDEEKMRKMLWALQLRNLTVTIEKE